MNTVTDAASTVSTASSLAAAAQSNSKSSSDNLGVSMSDFLKILSAELQYQDPMSDSSSGGSSNTDYISQMVEYSLLAQVQSMTSQIKYASAPSAIGQTVLYTGKDDSGNVTYTTGTVSAVELSGDSPAYLVDGVWVDQSNIEGFCKAAPTTGTGGTTGTSGTGT